MINLQDVWILLYACWAGTDSLVLNSNPPQFQGLIPMILPLVLKRGVSVLPLNNTAYTRRQWDTRETHERNLGSGRQRRGGWDKGDKTATPIRINRRILTISNETRGSNLSVRCKKWQSLLLASPVGSVICFWRTGRDNWCFLSWILISGDVDGNITGAFISLRSSCIPFIHWKNSLATLRGNTTRGRSRKQNCPLQQFVGKINECIYSWGEMWLVKVFVWVSCIFPLSFRNKHTFIYALELKCN